MGFQLCYECPFCEKKSSPFFHFFAFFFAWPAWYYPRQTAGGWISLARAGKAPPPGLLKQAFRD